MRYAVSVLVSAALLLLIYLLVDVPGIVVAMRGADAPLLLAGILIMIPLTLATAWRLSILAGTANIHVVESTRLVLMASTLNLFMPSKLGDIAKAAFLVQRHGVEGRLALSITILEKALDLSSLLFIGLIALVYAGLGSPLFWGLAAFAVVLLIAMSIVIGPFGVVPVAMRATHWVLPERISNHLRGFAEVWQSVVTWFWSNKARAIAVISLSLALWAGHLAQFWLFALAIGAAIPLVENMVAATLAILAGLAPFTVAGIGSRDIALIYFYGTYLTPSEGALLAILVTLRYLIPGIAGLPFVTQRHRSDLAGQMLQSSSAATSSRYRP